MKPKNRVVCPQLGREKMLFASESKAMNFIKWNGDTILDENGYAPNRAYYCPYCGGWHITHCRRSENNSNENKVEKAIKAYNDIM